MAGVTRPEKNEASQALDPTRRSHHSSHEGASPRRIAWRTVSRYTSSWARYDATAWSCLSRSVLKSATTTRRRDRDRRDRACRATQNRRARAARAPPSPAVGSPRNRSASGSAGTRRSPPTPRARLPPDRTRPRSRAAGERGEPSECDAFVPDAVPRFEEAVHDRSGRACDRSIGAGGHGERSESSPRELFDAARAREGGREASALSARAPPRTPPASRPRRVVRSASAAASPTARLGRCDGARGRPRPGPRPRAARPGRTPRARGRASSRRARGCRAGGAEHDQTIARAGEGHVEDPGLLRLVVAGVLAVEPDPRPSVRRRRRTPRSGCARASRRSRTSAATRRDSPLAPGRRRTRTDSRAPSRRGRSRSAPLPSPRHRAVSRPRGCRRAAPRSRPVRPAARTLPSDCDLGGGRRELAEIRDPLRALERDRAHDREPRPPRT